MSELTVAQEQELRGALTALHQSLQQSLRSLAQASQIVDLGEPIGRLTRMDAMQQASMARANRSDAQARLQRVQAALQRFERDEYGLCARCEDDIGYARLKVRPEAVLCIDCQSRSELRRR